MSEDAASSSSYWPPDYEENAEEFERDPSDSSDIMLKAGMFVTTYNIQTLELHKLKNQKMMISLSTPFKKEQETVKTKKKLCF